MYRIDDPSASATLPTPEAALTEGYWTEGNPGTGTPATLERASWFNMVQEELRAIVVAAGLTPSKTTYNQVLTAIKSMMGSFRGVVAYSTNQTLTTAVLNQAIDWFGPSGGVLTLPSGGSMSVGSTLTFYNYGAGTLIIQVAGGSDFLYAGANYTSITIQQGGNLELLARGTNEIDVIGGSAALQFYPTPVAPATASQHAVQLGQLFPSIGATVASNALTGTLVAPTALPFRNPTLTSGAPVVGSIAANLSLTVPSGATLGTTSGTVARLVWLVAYNGGTPVLCVVNLNGAPNLDETALISPTTISSGATSAGTIYSASAVSANSPFRVVGFSDISEAVAGTWATGPTTVQGIGGQALASMNSIGYGQSWQSVTGSRALGTTYVNTTGRPIMVNVATTSSATQSTTQLTVNGIAIIGSSNYSAGAPASAVIAIVPPGATYVASVTSGTGTLVAWSEMR